jgi:hypothetical protein
VGDFAFGRHHSGAFASAELVLIEGAAVGGGLSAHRRLSVGPDTSIRGDTILGFSGRTMV